MKKRNEAGEALVDAAVKKDYSVEPNGLVSQQRFAV